MRFVFENMFVLVWFTLGGFTIVWCSSVFVWFGFDVRLFLWFFVTFSLLLLFWFQRLFPPLCKEMPVCVTPAPRKQCSPGPIRHPFRLYAKTFIYFQIRPRKCVPLTYWRPAWNPCGSKSSCEASMSSPRRCPRSISCAVTLSVEMSRHVITCHATSRQRH